MTDQNDITDVKTMCDVALLAAIAELRRDMYEGGFRPIAVYTYDAGVESAGKRPIDKAWQDGAKQTPPRAVLQPVAGNALNTGILCNGLRPIDIDIDDPQLADRIQSMAEQRFGRAPLKFRSNSAKRTLLYKAALGEPSKKSRTGASHSKSDSVKVEVLGADNQMVAHGVHPSGVLIQWKDDLAPGNRLTVEELKPITEEAVDGFLDEVAEIIGSPAKTARIGTMAAGAGQASANSSVHDYGGASIVDVAAALAVIPNDGPADWEKWKRIGMAVWSATRGSDDGFNAFATWSRKNSAHDEAAVRQCWYEITASPPDRIGAGTLFYLAAEASPRWRKSISDNHPAPTSDISDANIAGSSSALPELPPGYRMTSEGLFFFEKGKEDGGTWKQVSAPFDPIGDCCNPGSGEWGIVIRWEDARGVKKQKIIPRSDLPRREGGSTIASTLEAEGLRCSANPALLRNFFVHLKPRRILTIAPAAGWHDSDDKRWTYLLPNGEVIGDTQDEVILSPGAVRSGRESTQNGTLVDWQEKVAKYARGNSRLTLFMCAALAAPLLAINSEPSGGFHLVGKSRSGKSTAQFMAASAWGPSKVRVAQWRATANGLEGMARAASDGPLFLDEIGQADAKTAGDAIYMLANEAGKQRAKVDGSGRERASWRTLFLSTGEIELETKMKEANRAAAAGLHVRLVNIEADAGAGFGVFEDIHGFKSAAEFADHLRAVTNQYYGVASRVFLQYLAEMRTQNSEGLAEMVKGFRRTFRDAYLHEQPVDGQIESVAGRFALIAAAGELGIAFNVLNWQQGDAIIAAGKCFEQWLSSRGHTGAGEDEAAITHVRRFIVANGTSRFADYEAPHETVRDCVGWRRSDSGETDYLFDVDQWNSVVFNGTALNPKRAIEALDQSGHLKKMEGRKTAKAKINCRPIRVYWVKGTILGSED
ncbi:DUF927 domain-containing protein [Salinarimonas ramus]|uniref:DUF927 domain-containing protein n=1 Tax=Salinarimonas ramus TaxID=690164 RepID=A0A917QLK6_9HYPH|nr:DUF927 domain-containing protein [Salinarimonas ramus]GGK55716.1 hypothetical protein GCM10011322_47970 [Salinarimonas ramus]